MAKGRVTLRNTNPDVKGTWECAVDAVDAWRSKNWIPVGETSEPSEDSEPVPARNKSRKESS